MTDNPTPYTGLDGEDQICFVDTTQCLKKLSFFVVTHAPYETALTDEGFDGYIGMCPSIDSTTGKNIATKPTFVTALVD